MARTISEVLPDLGQFYGTQGYLRHRLLPSMPGVLLTDGAKYVAEKAGAYWLMDTIALNCRDWLLEGNGFCVVKLKVEGSKCSLDVTDGDGHTLWGEVVAFTDFPEPGIEFFLQDAPELGEPVLMLKNEY